MGGVTRRVLCTWQLLGLAVKKTMVGLRWASYHSGYMSRLRKRYSHLLEGSFLARKVSWAPSRYLPTESADYCMLVNK